jgi:hypothetical protein
VCRQEVVAERVERRDGGRKQEQAAGSEGGHAPAMDGAASDRREIDERKRNDG